MTPRENDPRAGAPGTAATDPNDRAPGRETSALDVDVLVVGGGIQGLSVLHEVRRRGVESAFLVTREALGAGETLHSHGYMMRGYMLPPDAPLALAQALSSAFDWWSRFMEDHDLRDGEGSPTYLGAADSAVASRWNELGLPFELLSPPPPPFAGGRYERTGRLYRTHERIFLGSAIVDALAGELSGHAGQGEVTALHLNGQQDRIVACDVEAGHRTVRFRPSFVVLAAGRSNSRLLRGIGFGGSAPQPLTDGLEAPVVVRDVPMILVRGRGLPDVSGFFLDAMVSVATHSLGAGERMWVATPIGGHATTRDDDGGLREPRFDPALVNEGLERLKSILPGARALLDGDVRLSAYFGPKVDHPSGAPTSWVGGVRVANLRAVWPVLLSLARPAAVEVVRQLEQTEAWQEVLRARRPLDARVRALSGVAVGTERRLSESQRWYSPSEFRSLLRTG